MAASACGAAGCRDDADNAEAACCLAETKSRPQGPDDVHLRVGGFDLLANGGRHIPSTPRASAPTSPASRQSPCRVSSGERRTYSGALLLDVRDSQEYEAGHIIEARNLPAAELGAKAETLLKKYKEKPVIVYCESGAASGAAARTLRAAGFSKVVTLRGGLQSWRQENLPLVKGAARKDGKQG